MESAHLCINLVNWLAEEDTVFSRNSSQVENYFSSKLLCFSWISSNCQASSKSGCRDSQSEEQAEERPLISSHSQSTALLVSFLLRGCHQLGVAPSSTEEACVNVLGILLPLLHGQDPSVLTSYGKNCMLDLHFHFLSSKRLECIAPICNLYLNLLLFFFNGYSENIRCLLSAV